MPQRKIIYILIPIILSGLLIYLGYFLGQRGKEVSQLESEKPEAVVSNTMEAGAVGEVMAKEEETGGEAPLVSPTMPPAIFSTAGTITEIKLDRVIIKGEGTNFADGIPRTLTVIFTADTFTFVSYQAFRWQGLTGLKQLKDGMQILIESQANIRGKTDFEAKTVNIL